MSSIDLVILGMVLETPQSAYDLQKDVEYHQLSRWTKISAPSIYKKVLRLKESGYLKSKTVKGNKFAEKAVYAITEDGEKYFEQLMDTYVNQPISFPLDFNVVITNLNKMEKDKALLLTKKLRINITTAMETNQKYANDYPDIPLVGRTIFDQQRLLYQSLLEWMDLFENQFRKEKSYGYQKQFNDLV